MNPVEEGRIRHTYALLTIYGILDNVKDPIGLTNAVCILRMRAKLYSASCQYLEANAFIAAARNLDMVAVPKLWRTR